MNTLLRLLCRLGFHVMLADVYTTLTRVNYQCPRCKQFITVRLVNGKWKKEK